MRFSVHYRKGKREASEIAQPVMALEDKTDPT